MNIATKMPEVDAAREVLGLTLDEVAKSLGVNYSTLYRWRAGGTPNAHLSDRLEQLGELVGEIAQALSREVISEWLETPASAFEGRTPREMVLSGRGETVLGALLFSRHIYSALAEVREAKGTSPLLPEKGEIEDLPLSTLAALAMLDADIASLVGRMQTLDSKRARQEFLETRPRVRLD